MNSNCSTCDYMKMRQDGDGHCYMFKDVPEFTCQQHTSNKSPATFSTLSAALAAIASLGDIHGKA